MHDIDEEEEEDADYEDADDDVYYDDVDEDTGDLYEDASITCDEVAVSPSSLSTSLNFVDGFGFGPGTIDRRTISSRCQTPSMILASLISLDNLHPSDTIVATSAQVPTLPLLPTTEIDGSSGSHIFIFPVANILLYKRG